MVGIQFYRTGAGWAVATVGKNQITFDGPLPG